MRAGPYRLDLGDVLYAPNAFVDPAGRTLMLAWLQELRSGGAYKYAGCLSAQRVLTLRGKRCHPRLPLSWLGCVCSCRLLDRSRDEALKITGDQGTLPECVRPAPQEAGCTRSQRPSWRSFAARMPAASAPVGMRSALMTDAYCLRSRDRAPTWRSRCGGGAPARRGCCCARGCTPPMARRRPPPPPS